MTWGDAAALAWGTVSTLAAGVAAGAAVALCLDLRDLRAGRNQPTPTWTARDLLGRPKPPCWCGVPTCRAVTDLSVPPPL